MSLKELTWEHHKNAERQEYVKVMFSGKINPELYATYLYNQHAAYDLLEAMAMAHGLFDTIPEVRRAPNILKDFDELWDKQERPAKCKATFEYIDYLKTIMHDPKKLMAHVYVRHMGDLSGGQMIAKRIPGSGNFYMFDADVEDLKNRIRELLDDSMADEAKVCFDFATKLFKNLSEIEIEPYLEQVD